MWPGGPLQDLSRPGVPSRCPKGPSPPPWGTRLWLDPAPWAWRLASTRSALASWLLTEVWERLVLVQTSGPTEQRPAQEMFEDAKVVLDAIRREAEARGARSYATLLPWSGMRLPPDHERWVRAQARGWAEVLAASGFETLDLTDALETVTDPPVPGVYVSDDPPDGHFGPVGFAMIHDRFAPWILLRLTQQDPVRPPPSPSRGPAAPRE